MPTAAACDPRFGPEAGVVERVVALHDRLASLPDLRPGPVVDGLFRELVGLALSSAPVGEAVLTDPAVASLLPSLVGLCGRAECQLELAWADRVAGGAAPRRVLEAFPYLANYHELSRLEHRLVAASLGGCPLRRVAFVGSGPLPLTGLLLSHSFGVPVDNIDRDPAAVALARRLGDALGADLCEFHERDLFDCDDLDRYDLVVLAALVGLAPADKERALVHLAATMRPGALLLARSAHGLRRLLYPVVDVSVVPGFDQLTVVHPPTPVINSVVLARRQPVPDAGVLAAGRRHANMTAVSASSPDPDLRLRPATAGDIRGIAALHVDNWRRGYRGAFSDAYLDGDVESDRLRVWNRRLGGPQPDRPAATVVLVGPDADAAVDGAVLGFAHVIFDDHPRWGALLENLHVVHDLQGQGWGGVLIRAAAAAAVEHDPTSGFHLEVLDQNIGAQGFYDRLGGIRVESYPWTPPGGGSTISHRYAWADPSVLLAD
jgi:nicotianamine synthase